MTDDEPSMLEPADRVEQLPPVPDHGPAVQEIWYDETDDDGYWYGSDDYGEFRLDGGSPEPLDDSDLKYEPCNAILKFTEERYGERRFCKAMSGDNFNQDYSTCRRHKGQEKLLETRGDKMTTGAHAASHRNRFKFMDPHEQVITNDLYESLVDQSAFDFDLQYVELQIDVSDDSFGGDTELMTLEHPVPRDNEVRCKALWHAAIDFAIIDMMRDKQFKDAFEDSTSVGERESVVAVTDEGETIYDEEEHHLNLPISRLQRNYKEYLSFGGVTHDVPESMENDTVSTEWHVDITPQDSAPSDLTDAAEETTASKMISDDVAESPLDDIEQPQDGSQSADDSE